MIPPRYIYKGDREGCESLRGLGATQLRILLEQMAYRGLKQYVRRINFDDGREIIVRSTFGLNQIEIICPVLPPPPLSPFEIIEPAVLQFALSNLAGAITTFWFNVETMKFTQNPKAAYEIETTPVLYYTDLHPPKRLYTSGFNKDTGCVWVANHNKIEDPVFHNWTDPFIRYHSFVPGSTEDNAKWVSGLFFDNALPQDPDVIFLTQTAPEDQTLKNLITHYVLSAYEGNLRRDTYAVNGASVKLIDTLPMVYQNPTEAYNQWTALAFGENPLPTGANAIAEYIPVTFDLEDLAFRSTFADPDFGDPTTSYISSHTNTQTDYSDSWTDAIGGPGCEYWVPDHSTTHYLYTTSGAYAYTAQGYVHGTLFALPFPQTPYAPTNFLRLQKSGSHIDSEYAGHFSGVTFHDNYAEVTYSGCPPDEEWVDLDCYQSVFGGCHEIPFSCSVSGTVQGVASETALYVGRFGEEPMFHQTEWGQSFSGTPHCMTPPVFWFGEGSTHTNIFETTIVLDELVNDPVVSASSCRLKKLNERFYDYIATYTKGHVFKLHTRESTQTDFTDITERFQAQFLAQFGHEFPLSPPDEPSSNDFHYMVLYKDETKLQISQA